MAQRLHRRAQGYRVRRGNDPRTLAELRTFAGRTVDVPICFIAGTSDWGSYKTPGELEAMQSTGLTNWRGTHFVDGAGHGAAGTAGSDNEAPHRLLRRPAVTIRRRAFLSLLAGALPAMSEVARAQDYPTRPVRLVVGFAAGGTQDMIARLVGSGSPNSSASRSWSRTAPAPPAISPPKR